MRRTVPSVLRERPPKGSDFTTWAQEVIPAVRELQSRANAGYSGDFTYTTTNTAAFETAWTSDDMPGDGVWRVEVEAQAVADDGSGAFYCRRAQYKRVASGVATIVGAVSTIGTDTEDVAGWDVQFSTSTNALLFQVKGDATRVVEWTVTVNVKEKVPS